MRGGKGEDFAPDLAFCNAAHTFFLPAFSRAPGRTGGAGQIVMDNVRLSGERIKFKQRRMPEEGDLRNVERRRDVHEAGIGAD